MYRDTLSNQWKNLYSDFAGEYDTLVKQMNEPICFNRWYEARIHRWNSITFPEGIILEQENNRDFANELKLTLDKFSFNKVESAKTKSIWFGIVIGIAFGLIVGGVLYLLPLDLLFWRIIISGIISAVMVSAVFIKKHNVTKKQEKKRVKDAYIRQLEEYEKELIAVCDKYQK